MKFALFISFILIETFCNGQIYPTRDSIHIFWQPGLKITFNDYKGSPTAQTQEIMDKYDISVMASVGIWSVLDTPKKKRDRYRKFEKVYFAPAFERTTSYARTNDSIQIAIQNTYLDICEIWARWARQQLQSWQDTTKATGTLTIMYMTVKQEMNENRLKMYGGYFKDVIAEKKEGAFKEWRNLIEKWLDDTEQWAAKPEECYRLMTQQPIEEGYILAPTVLGPMFNEKK
jgi:hypothetical protein